MPRSSGKQQVEDMKNDFARKPFDVAEIVNNMA